MSYVGRTIEYFLTQHYFDPRDYIDHSRVMINNCKVTSMDEVLEQGDSVIVTLMYDLGIRSFVIE